MWEEALKIAVQNGLWAVMFLCLLVYQLRDSWKRERKYQETIRELTKSLGAVQNIREDVGEIKKNIYAKRGAINE